MKKIISLALIFCVGGQVFAQTSGSPNKCRIFEINEANAIKEGCALITDKDFEDARKQCHAEKKKMSQACQTSQINLQSRIYELNSSYQNYLQKKQGYSAQNDAHLDDFIRKANDALTLVEQIQTGSRCDIMSTAGSLLPIVSMLNAPAALLLGSGSGLVERLINIFKEQKMDIGSKLAICASNKKFQAARTEACLTLEMSDPKYKDSIRVQIDFVEKKCAAARNTKAYRLLSAINENNSFVGYLRNQSPDQSSRQLSNSFLQKIESTQRQIDCRNPLSKSICDKLNFIKTSLSSSAFNDSTVNTDQRNEMVLKISRTYDDIQEEVWNVTFQSKSTYYLTGESLEVGKSAQSCLFDEKIDAQRKKLYERQLSQNLDFDVAARLVKDGISSLPDKMSSNLETGLCEATACIWGEAQSNPPPTQRALSGKNLHPKSWDPIAKQSLASYTSAGEATFQSWGLVVKEKQTFLNSLTARCKNQTSKCQISCRESDEELMRRHGNHIVTDETGMHIVEPSRVRGAF